MLPDNNSCREGSILELIDIAYDTLYKSKEFNDKAINFITKRTIKVRKFIRDIKNSILNIVKIIKQEIKYHKRLW